MQIFLEPVLVLKALDRSNFDSIHLIFFLPSFHILPSFVTMKWSLKTMFADENVPEIPHGNPNTDIYGPEAVTQDLEKQGDVNTAFGDKSPGVRRIEAIVKSLSTADKWVLWLSVLLTAYSYGLDLYVRNTYQAQALSIFGSSAQVSTVGVVRSIVAAAAQPLFAKISDYFGRVSILFISVVFYVVGTILQAASNNLDQYLGGAVLYQFGYTGTQRELTASHFIPF